MASIAEIIRQADERLRTQLDVAVGLDRVLERLDRTPSHEVAATAREVLARRKRALETAQLRICQLDDTVVEVSRLMPFLPEGWAEQRAALEQAKSQSDQDGLAAWLNYWFAAAGSFRIDALRRLRSDVPLPPTSSIPAKRIDKATEAFVKDWRTCHDVDWQTCHDTLEFGVQGVDVGSRQVPDRLVQGRREPDQVVRENLRLLDIRLALCHRRFDEADAALGPADRNQGTAPRLALRSRLARLRGAGEEAGSLLKRARDLDPHDLDVTVEAIEQARRREEPDFALDSARSAVGALRSLVNVKAGIGRLLDAPPELWIAVAERARDEGDQDGALRFLAKAEQLTQWNQEEIAAVIDERRAEIAVSPAERRQALIRAGERRTELGQMERARRNYEAATAGTPRDGKDAFAQASAKFRWADIVSALARQRPYRDVADDLVDALARLQEAQRQVDVNGAESWTYLTECDLCVQLSKAPGAVDRYLQEWAALLAAARAAALTPTWSRSWLTLAEAATTRGLFRVAEAAARQAWNIERDRTTRASYLQAIVRVGRYQDALELLAGVDDAWSRCMLGHLALRLGKADEAIQHFTGPAIGPTWFWAWRSFVRALVLTDDLASAQQKSEEFLSVIAGRKNERSWLQAAAFDAHLHGLPSAAREFADDLVQAAGPDDVDALYTLGEALVLDRDRTGWEMLTRALVEDPSPTCLDVWERQERPLLAALALCRGLELDFTRLDPPVRQIRHRRDPGDPLAELRRMAAAAREPSAAARAARLTEAVLRTTVDATDPALEELLEELTTEDGLGAEADSLRRHLLTRMESSS